VPPATHRLITIPLSHYCERARWALDRAGVDYVEEPHLQGFHARAVRRAGGRRTTPVLVTPHTVLADSADIVRFAVESCGGTRLAEPASEAMRELEKRHADRLGVETRRLAYHLLLPERRVLLEHNNRGAPLHQRLGVRLTFPLLARTLRRYLRIDESTAARARQRIAEDFDEVAALLSDSRPYLDGDRFTSADLTFAALAAPMLMPPQYGGPAPDIERLRPAVATEMRRWREHPAGRFAMRLYSEERR